MPIYEYYCRQCDGVFETLRPMRLAAEPAACPECRRDGLRIMPSSFAAFTFRDGYPRKLPDKGTYWHLGKEVKNRISGSFRPWEHPELNKQEPPKRKSKGDEEIERDKQRLRKKELAKMRKSGVVESKYSLPRSLQ